MDTVQRPELQLDMHKSVFGAAVALFMLVRAAAAGPVTIVAAENFYGDIARQIGGDEAAVTSILVNPDQDPHAFEARASTARAIADAKLVIYNGIGYDPWALKLISASRRPERVVIEVARLVGRKSGDNPHVWYDPATMPRLARALAESLSRLDPEHRADFAGRLESFLASMRPLDDRIAALRAKLAGTAVTATEPVFGYMADALGLAMQNDRFQLAVMNGTEPSARDIAAFETGLRTHAVKVLIYNSQTSQKLAEHMRNLATEAGVPVIAVTETEPEGKTYQEWMLSQLDALDRALRTR
jgi:zinc/manganese transport system substrate-binding protein